MIARTPRPGKRLTVEDCLTISTEDFKEVLRSEDGGGIVTWKVEKKMIASLHFVVEEKSDTLALRLEYTHTASDTGKKTLLNYKIPIQRTQPQFGGARYWFTCPLTNDGEPCNRRVGKLYLPPGGHYFGCRHCHYLTYKSCQNSHRFDRLYEEIATILSENAPPGLPEITPKMIKDSLREDFDE